MFGKQTTTIAELSPGNHLTGLIKRPCMSTCAYQKSTVTHPCSEHCSVAALQHLLQLLVCCRFPSWDQMKRRTKTQQVGVNITDDLHRHLWGSVKGSDITHWSQAVSGCALYSAPWSPPVPRCIWSSPPQTSWTAQHAGGKNKGDRQIERKCLKMAKIWVYELVSTTNFDMVCCYFIYNSELLEPCAVTVLVTS